VADVGGIRAIAGHAKPFADKGAVGHIDDGIQIIDVGSASTGNGSKVCWWCHVGVSRKGVSGQRAAVWRDDT
jgi:hypothetical protein